MILPVQELAAFPRCSACEQLKEEERFSACRHLSAPLLHDEFHWQSDPRPCSGSLGRTDSACSERTDIIFDSEPDHWKQDLDVAGDRCPHVPGPQPALPFQLRLLLRELFLAHSPSDPDRSIRGSSLTKTDWLSSGAPHTQRTPSSCSRPALSPIDVRSVAKNGNFRRQPQRAQGIPSLCAVRPSLQHPMHVH